MAELRMREALRDAMDGSESRVSAEPKVGDEPEAINREGSED